jgi:hypothetical protein
MKGYSFVRGLESQIIAAPPSLKVLAYADDVCVFVLSFSDFHRLQHHLSTYGNVSNARLNMHKTEAISLNRQHKPLWINFLADQNISQWHDDFANEPLRYLDFSPVQSPVQRKYLENQLLQIVKTSCAMYSQRVLSLRGRLTVVNTLILSKIWYCLRLARVSQSFFSQLQSVVYQFV